MQGDLAGEIQLTGIFPLFYSCFSDHLLLSKGPLSGPVLGSRHLAPDLFRNFLALCMWRQA